MSKLKILNIASNNFGNGVLKKISECNLNKLVELQCNNIGVNNYSGMLALSNNPAYSNLEHLNLYRN